MSKVFKKKYYNKNRWNSFYYQAAEILKIAKNIDDCNVLEVGPGNYTLNDFIERAGINITSLDFDQKLNPDIIADVKKIPINSNTFDIICCFEVLEHIEFEFFNEALQELNRVSKKYVLLSLPYNYSDFSLALQLKPSGLKRKFEFKLRLPKIFGNLRAKEEHYWEIGLGKKRKKLDFVKKNIEKHFIILKNYYPVENLYHHFFVLEKKH